MVEKQRVDYHRYMASREWRLKRKEVIERQDNVCARCLSAEIRDVHHLTYERLGDEDARNDLEGLCRPCHRYVSGEQDDDPGARAVMRSLLASGIDIEYLIPDGQGGGERLYESTGPTTKDRYFALRFSLTEEPKSDMVLQWVPGVYLHASEGL